MPNSAIDLSFFTTITDHIDDIVWKLDLKTRRFVYISPSVLKVRGFTPEEAMQLTLEESLPAPEYLQIQAAIEDYAQKARSGVKFPLHFKSELRHNRKGGGYVWLEVKTTAILGEDGVPIYALGVSRDITEQKHRKAELEESLEREKFFADIIRQSSQPMALGRLDGEIVLLNQAAFDLFGYSEEEIGLKNWIVDLTPVKWIEKEKEILAESIRNNQSINYKKEFFHKSGRIIPVNMRVFPKVNDDNESSHFIAFINDLSEVETTKYLLQESLERFDLALKGSNDGFWDLNMETNYLFMSPRYLEIIGYKANELNPVIDSFWKFVHQDDIDKVYKTQDLLLMDKNSSSEIQFRLRHKDGHYVHILSKAHLLRDEMGNPVRLVGTHIDMSELLEVKNNLKESEEKYRLLFSNTNIGICTTTMDSFIVEANQCMYDLLGVDCPTDGSMINIRQFYQNANDRVYFLQILENEGQVRNFQLQIVKENGTPIWVSISSKKVFISGQSFILNAVLDITKQMRTEVKLRESEERFKQLSKLTLEGILIHDNGKVLDINNSLVKMLGVSRSAILGKNFFDYCSNDKPIEAVMMILNGNKATHEIDLINKNGIRVPVELTGRKTVFQGKKVIVNSIRDLSYRIAAEANIRILSTAVEQSGHSVVISDVEGIIEYANQQFYKTTGFEFVEINGQSVQKLRSAYHTHSFYYQIWKTLQKGKVWSGELLIKKADQSEYWVSAVCNPIIDRDDKITHYLGIMEDISEKRQSHEELVKARQQAEESDQLKSAFLANMSHEIRTPLNSIIGFTTLLQDDGDDYTRDEMKKYLSVINKNGEMLLHLVNDIIDISKIESGQMIISDLPFNFSELLDKLENSFDHMKKPEVSLTFQPWFSDFQLHTDFTRLVQILTNLITNAIKFTTKGDVFVGHSTDHLYLYMWVRDTGCGIPEELQHMIFERFAQGNPLRDQLLGGTGLGLSITKGLVHLLGGDIWIKSEEHKGSTFYFKLLLDHRKQNEL